METMRSSDKRRADIELCEVKQNEGVYEKIDKRNVNSHIYENLKTEKKTKTNNIRHEDIDKIKVVLVLLCVVVAALAVAAVTVSSVVFFGVTDGGWTDWEDWGACSVTCGTGFTTLIRTCSNPRPSIMGQYCDGSSVQVQSCNKTSCSVTDGGWTGWEDWGACSVTCGTGFTTRIRTCSNPRPSIMGRYCDGTSMQVRSCNNTLCSVTDGGWTGWGDWGACSVTCGTGFTTRIRTCSNPRPSIMGRYCDGTSVQVQTCNSASCSVKDGGWTNWGNWGVCSVTCGAGLITRLRTCSQPLLTGRYCDGTSEQTKICNDIPCSGDSVGFSVQQPYNYSGGNRLKFRTAHYNYNDVFNMTSGEFVCQKEGLYLFISTMLRTHKTISEICCNFYKNNNEFIAYGSIADSTNPSATSSILYPLKPGDRVYLGCKGLLYIGKASGFTGLLINPVH